MRRFLLRGRPADLALAIDRVHVDCEVLGVIERESEFEIFAAGPLPALADLRVVVVELGLEGGPPPTGFEDDRAIVVGAGLLVRPPWIPRPEGFAGVDLVVPRGMAFGSGEHGSTQAALLALDAVWPEPAPREFLDVGTGSGILALYARTRGVQAIAACDVEAASVEAARELLPDADVRSGGPEGFAPRRFGAVVANLDARQLDVAIESILERWSGCGPLVLSGLRADEVGALRPKLPAAMPQRFERLGYVALGWPRVDSGA